MRTTAINQSLEKSLSLERLNKYLQAANGDLNNALTLYERNIRLSEAFYTPLQCIEICLRNKLHAQLAAKYGADWYANTNSCPIDASERKRIGEAIDKLLQASKSITPANVIGELSFGFWVAILARKYDSTIWRDALFRAFTNPVGRHIARTIVHTRLNFLRVFRNRIAHHEPIFLGDLVNTHAEIIEATTWMCADTATWTLQQSRFQAVFAGKI